MAPLLWVTLAWLAGIFLQGWLSFQIAWLWAGTGVGLAVAFYYWLNNRHYDHLGRPEKLLPLALPLCLALFCLGALRLEGSLPSQRPDGISYWAGDLGSVPELRVKGVVAGDPAYTERGDTYRLTLRQIWPPGASAFRDVSGDIFVQAAPGDHPRLGDLLELAGRLQKPEVETKDGFPYREYLARQGMYAVMIKPSSVLLASGQDFFLTGWLNSLQNGSLDLINRFVPQPYSGLLGGILLGETQSIDPSLKDSFRMTGSSHVVAISGSNITIAAGAFMLLFGRYFRKRKALLLTIAGIAAYVLLVGASAGVVRAGIMGIIVITGLLMGREYTALYGLAGTVLLMTLFQPRVFYDVGFELSCMATLGLILIAQPLQKSSFFSNWPLILQEGVLLGLSAEIMTLPLSAYYFQQISLVSLPTSTFILPALPLIMLAGAVLVVGGWLFAWWLPLVPQAFGLLALCFLAYMVAVVYLFASLPFATISLPPVHPAWLFIYYGVLFATLGYWHSRENGKFRQRLHLLLHSRLAVGALAIASVAVWLTVFFG